MQIAPFGVEIWMNEFEGALFVGGVHAESAFRAAFVLKEFDQRFLTRTPRRVGGGEWTAIGTCRLE